jgi:PAS domain S-box-containing protein
MNEHERREDKLKLLEFSIDSIPDAVYWITMDGRFRNCNAAACRMLAYRREELLSLSFHDIDPDYSLEDGQSDLVELKRTGTLHLKRCHTTKDGRVIPVEVTFNYFIYNDVEYVCCIARDINELSQAQAELEKKVEERTAELAETVRALRFTQFAIDRAADQAFWMTDDGRFIYVNDAACRALGYTREELLRMSVPDINPTCSPEEFPVYWNESREKGSSTFETCHRAKDGRVFPVEIRSNYVIFDGEEYNCAFATDITERKKAKEELLLSRFCIDKAAIGIYQTDENGTIFNVNDYACASLGFLKEELFSLSVFDIDPAITGEKMLEIKRTLDRTGSVTHETVHRRKDGTTFPVEIAANLLEFRGKEFTISFVKDITERKRAEEELRASEAEKSLILNSTMDYVMYHDTDMKIMWANWKAAELTTLPVEEFIGRHCWEVVHRRDKPCEECPVVLARDTGEPQKMEKYSPNGLILNMRAYPIRSEEGKLLGIAEFASDITEQKRAEDALRKAHDELEARVRKRTEQLVSLTAELSLAEEKERRRIATELHDHVGQTLIMGKIRLDSLSPELPAEDLAASLADISRHLARSLEEIRSLTFQLSPPLLYEVGFEAAVEWLGEEFGEKYDFQVEFQDDGRRKPLDEETGVALYQMVRELLLNVAKHAKAKKTGISVEKVSDKIRICVADDGIGFDAMNGMGRKNRKRGFGLFNIRQRIDHMGGKLEMESRLGYGTRMTLLLPLRKKKKSTNRRKP